jgi:hypothetical protein
VQSHISADSVNMTSTCEKILTMTEPRKMKNNAAVPGATG